MRWSGSHSAPHLLLHLFLVLLLVAFATAVPQEARNEVKDGPAAASSPGHRLHNNGAPLDGAAQPDALVGAGAAPAEEAKEHEPLSAVSRVDAGGDVGFLHAVVASLSVIVVSELGDKTFFIAAIMAMRYNRMTVFAGAMAALAFMHCLSVLFGFATTVVPRVYTYYISTALFALFGVRMIRDGLRMGPDEGQEELEEVQAQIKRRDKEMEGDVESGTLSPPASSGSRRWWWFGGGCGGGGGGQLCRLYRATLPAVPPVLLQALTLTLVAEWGDRSQLATIVLASRENPLGVALGGCVGHGLCTGLAVIGGRMIAQRISVRTVTLVGGVVFLLFAVSSLFISPETAS
ncbi:putative divalent cation/proton antiporter TMEM165 [Petromyzon marinus]|uniref:GDT1 family protein n=1 Tax=Petromyzon marinus TaxID=7757 RepID=A0AAJ7WLE3_PETMA|nr:transmembrane protein 165 [Petromyzon marinus]